MIEIDFEIWNLKGKQLTDGLHPFSEKYAE